MLCDDCFVVAEIAVCRKVYGVGLNRARGLCFVQVTEEDFAVFTHEAAPYFCPLSFPTVHLDKKNPVAAVTFIGLVELPLMVEAYFDRIAVIAVCEPLDLLPVKVKSFLVCVAKQSPARFFQRCATGKE